MFSASTDVRSSFAHDRCCADSWKVQIVGTFNMRLSHADGSGFCSSDSDNNCKENADC